MTGLRVVEPATEAEVAAELREANDAGLAVAPRAGGTKLDWGNPPSRADLTMSLHKMNRVLEHAWADLTVTAEAGCTVAEVQRTVAARGQRLAIDVPWEEQATIGGILSTNDGGALRLRFGGLRDLVIGVTLALPDGTIARSGGNVVKNVAGYDLPKLVTGALGTLGVITQAVFRLHPAPHGTRTLTLRPGAMEDAQRLLLAIQNSQLAHSALQVRMAADGEPELDLLLEGTEAGIASQEAAVRGMAGGVSVSEGSPAVWREMEKVRSEGDRAVVKISVLPSDIAEAMTLLRKLAHGDAWRAVVQATGLGWAAMPAAHVLELRNALEARGGSCVVAKQPASGPRLEAWGVPGDAFPLMRAVKQQFDPKGTLNPGRFVGGI